ncbi:MAG: S8 family serine peptidase [Lachnospiraceae bacterium]|nr:S8 family serine peptidase [Lachnospiraceae bacterium]
MKRVIFKIISLLLTLLLIIDPFTAVPAGAVDLYIPDGVDGSNPSLEYYAAAAQMISEYWEDDYFTSLNFSDDTEACLIDGEWYLSADSFCEDAGLSYKQKGKRFTISSDEFTWSCRVGKKTSTIDGETYTFENKPVKKNGKYMINAEELENNLCYDIVQTDDGLSVTRPFQLKRLIVEMKSSRRISPDTYGAIKSAVNGNTYVLQFATEKDTKAAFEKLSENKKVSYVEPDKFISMIEPESGKQSENTVKKQNTQDFDDWDNWDDWGEIPGWDDLWNPGNDDGNTDDYGGSGADWNVAMLGADVLAERIKSAGVSGSVTVAIVDTGIDYNHSYLSQHVVSKGYDFINSDYDAYDDNSHGTHCAGIVINTASGANVKLLPVKVLSGQGYGSSLAVANGITYAAQQGADVINLSLGGASTGSNHYEDQAISTALSYGCVVVVAAGNESSDTAYSCPAHNNSAIVVAAIDSGKNRAYFSNYGSSVDVAAPGVDIYSTVPGNSYEYMSGTSMATPHVSGLAALVRLIRPSASCSTVESILRSCAQDLGTAGFDYYYGYGVPDVSALEINGGGDSYITPTPRPTAVPTSQPAPTQPAYPTQIVYPTQNPYPTQIVWPTQNPYPTQIVYPTQSPYPTQIVYPTQNPYPTQIVWPTQNPYPTQPVYSGNTSVSISTSSSYSNGKMMLNLSVVAGAGVKNIILVFSNGNREELVNNGSGINVTRSYQGGGITITYTAYDYYGNIVSSGSVGG